MIDDLDREAEEILHECMTNSYMIITNKLTFDDLLDYNGCALPFNPKKNIDNKVLPFVYQNVETKDGKEILGKSLF